MGVFSDIFEQTFRSFFLDLAVGNIVTYGELNGRFEEMDIFTSEFFRGYWAGDYDSRAELAARCRAAFPHFPEWVKLRAYECAQVFLDELPAMEDEIPGDELVQALDYVCGTVLYDDFFMLPEKYSRLDDDLDNFNPSHDWSL